MWNAIFFILCFECWVCLSPQLKRNHNALSLYEVTWKVVGTSGWNESIPSLAHLSQMELPSVVLLSHFCTQTIPSHHVAFIARIGRQIPMCFVRYSQAWIHSASANARTRKMRCELPLSSWGLAGSLEPHLSWHTLTRLSFHRFAQNRCVYHPKAFLHPLIVHLLAAIRN